MKFRIVLVICALLAVFIASNMTYEQQTIIPELQTLLKDEPFKEPLSKLEVHYWHQTISVETRGYVYFVEFLIRKATHFTGYGFIGIIFYAFYSRLKWRYAPLLAIATVFVIGSIDEFIQYHTPGRTGIFQDVLIDTSGAIFWVTIAAMLHYFLKKRKA